MRTFLSYSTRDFGLSEKLYQQLKDHVSSVWIDRLEMRAGDTLPDKIKEGISNSDNLLVLVTKNSIRSSWVRKEIKIAIDLGSAGKGPRIIPLVLHPCSVPRNLKDKLYVKIERQNLKIQEIIKAIYHKDYVLSLRLTSDFELDRASLARDLGEYLTASARDIHVHIENGGFNDKVRTVLKKTRKHRKIFIDNVDRLRQIDESLPVTLPAFWSSLAAISEELLTDLFAREGRSLGAAREITDAIEGIFEYSLRSLAFYLSNGIFQNEAESQKETGLARFILHNQCSNLRELTYKRLGILSGYEYHAIDLIAREGFMHTRVWAPVSDNDLSDLYPLGVRVEVSPVSVHWYKEYLPQIIGREILFNALYDGLSLQRGDRVVGLHMDNYEKAGLG